MLYMLMTPVEEAVRPKFPQAVTQTAYVECQLGILEKVRAAYFDGADCGSLFLPFSKVIDMLSYTLVFHGPCPRNRFVCMSGQDVVPVFSTGRRVRQCGDRWKLQ